MLLGFIFLGGLCSLSLTYFLLMLCLYFSFILIDFFPLSPYISSLSFHFHFISLRFGKDKTYPLIHHFLWKMEAKTDPSFLIFGADQLVFKNVLFRDVKFCSVLFILVIIIIIIIIIHFLTLNFIE